MSLTTEELVQYYANLLIIQYRGKAKAVETVERVLRTIIPVELAQEVRDGFDFDSAVGAQLDILGKYIGSDRVVTGSAFTRDYWGYSEYGDVSPFDFFPYMAYGEIPPDVQIRNYRESTQGLYSLNDEEYRFILRLKIVINSSNGTNEDIDDLIEALFNNNAIFTDRENMTVSYIFEETDSRLVTIALSEGLLPKPAAVGVIVSTTPDITAIFGYGEYGEEPASFVVGYGSYGVESEGGWVFYG